jgi:hypothetical protein
MRRASVAIGIAAVLVSAGVATPAQAAYQDPLTEGDLVNYNHTTYALSIKPAAGADRVTRFGHTVPATYSVRVLLAKRSGETVVYSGKLGYYRTAYLRLKTVSRDTVRDYGVRTYLKKVTGFSAAYAKNKVVAHTVAYRHRVLRADVAMTVSNCGGYVQDHGSTSGMGSGLIVKDEGFFGYENARIEILPDAYGTGSTTDYVVYGYDPIDGYSVMVDSRSGATTTTRSDDDRALLR